MKIVFNGREYDGIEQMPPEVRQEYLYVVQKLGDADGDGVPDVLEQPRSSNAVVHETFIYNGREYKDRSELPAEVQEALARMPPPNPGDVETRIEVETKVLPSKVDVVTRRLADEEWEPRRSRPGYSWVLVTILLVIIGLLLLLWLSGIKPADLWRR